MIRSFTFSYEALVADPRAEFDRALAALDLERRDDLVDTTIRNASFEHLKGLSTSAAYAGTVLAPAHPDDPDSYKVRNGDRSSYQLPVH